MPDDIDTNDSEGIKNLRKQFDELSKQNKQLLDELTGYRTADRNKAVGDILKAKGVSEKLAGLYSGDDTSEGAVAKWLEDYGLQGSASQQNDPNIEAAHRVAEATYGSDYSVETPQQGVFVGNPDEIRTLLNTLPQEELVKRGFIPDPKSLLG